MTILYDISDSIDAALRLEHSLRATFNKVQPIFKIVLTPQDRVFEVQLSFEATDPKYHSVAEAMFKIFNSPRSGSIDRDYDYIRKNGY